VVQVPLHSTGAASRPTAVLLPPGPPLEPARVNVTHDRASYPVLIGRGLSRQLAVLLEAHGISSQRLVVSVPRVWRLHARRFPGLLARGQRSVLLADGERSKTLASVERIYGECLRQGLDRSGAIIAIGGGVVGDISGFAAATYLRGIRIVQVPTTLLAQVDSAVGGKVGVNLPAGKNLVGAFHPPTLVICDPEVLTTLPAREFRSGLYEVVKYGVLSSASLFATVASALRAILERDQAVLAPLIAECCRIKAAVVMADEREAGPRRVLNFGHTIGHALEAITRYRRFRHGEAIGHGMLAAARLSVLRGLLSADDEARLTTVIRQLGPLPRVVDLSIRDALEVIGRDKKVVRGRLHFVLARGIGATEIVSDVNTSELRTAMRHLGMKA
jgi:3-dehydroquinate synthase